jgi:putative transposase
MAYVRNWMHCVWNTKNHVPFLGKEIKQSVIDHIKSNAKEKQIYIDIINGSVEHIHCLISLQADQTLAKVMQLIKGESSYWINKNQLTKTKFEWAVEYYGTSISNSETPKLRNYIRNQEEHHKKGSWTEELDSFLSENDLET